MQIEAIEIRNYRLFLDAKLTDCSKEWDHDEL